MGSQPGYRADIDGLRALAVLPVILFHSGIAAFSGGYIGVDVFFVISGAVIALSIERELVAGHFTVSGFYERRARRILPALTLALITTAAAAIVVAPPFYFEPFAHSLPFTAGFLSNIYFWTNSGYFNAESPFLPLLHTWSLGVEEQYYLVAPLILLAIFAWLRSRWRLGLIPLLLASFALSVYAMSYRQELAAFFSLPTRAWELLLGAVIALAPPPQISHRASREALAILALGLIAAPILLYSQDTPFPGLSALPPTLGAAMLIYLGEAREQTTISRALSWRPLVAIGLISYALYLVHWPILVFAPFVLLRPLTPQEIALALVACFVLATALYVWVERPLRRAPAPRWAVFTLAIGAIAVTAGLGVIGPKLNAKLYANTPEGAFRLDWDAGGQDLGAGTCLLISGTQTYHDWRQDQCVRATGPGADILLWGDSFAAHYAPGVQEAGGRASGRVIQYTLQGCPPVQSANAWEDCRAFAAHAFEVIRAQRIRRIVLAANWIEYGPGALEQIGPTLAILQRTGAEVTVIGQSPHFYVPPFLIAARRGAVDAADFATASDPRGPAINRALAAQASRYGARFIDPLAHLCQRNFCATRANHVELYFDSGHFTPAGSARATGAYFPYLAPAQN